ncbi:hypothetical protein H5410_047182 [Solanum commersonii]|uniref:Uncharacterized protein n=1 Tax=Solanum commersonii TaxID=4109 RepID=A0A9J5XHJ8_SOLCO|nr:hypothetical protein H5410_047182 [Solanum commersonii]
MICNSIEDPIVTALRLLNLWSKHQNFKKMEAENCLEQGEIQPSIRNRSELSKVEAELKKYLRIEEEFWRQKAEMKWVLERDKKTIFPLLC